MKFLITGSAGFIGFHLARRLLDEGQEVTGIDGFTSYYDTSLKRARHAALKQRPTFHEAELMLEDSNALAEVVVAEQPAVVIHLAAQAGVRYSVENPRAYVESNIAGTFNLLEAIRGLDLKHLLIASTSSVYGDNPDTPFKESDLTLHPLSLYAATKSSMEVISHSYSHLWGIPTTAFRFFTVYGPWGRPDMALFKFVRAILEGQPIEVFNQGQLWRDFTFIDDLVEAVCRLIPLAPALGHAVTGDSLSPSAPWRVVNIGGGEPVNLMEFIAATERVLGRTASLSMEPMQQGDVRRTWADSGLLETLTGFRPETRLEKGIGAFWDWYREFYA
jgi:UDP-glucuronate 4-epimerase